LYDLQDEVKKQRREIFNARKQNDNDWLKILEEEMNQSLRAIDVIEEEIRRTEDPASAAIATPVRRNTLPRSQS
jgi:hypothetical protein